ncbi:MAG: hypothetical protein RI907_3818 [Pseudomonadota bacterium]|jgi:hypothetical protein
MKLRHAFGAFALALAYAACSLAFLYAASVHAATASPQAGTPANAAPVDLGALGVVEQEFFVQGTANSYSAAGTWPSDGRWGVEIKQAGLAYQTRILARYPADAARFNGTVVVEWFNVTGFTDLEIDGAYMREELLAQGYAWVGVSAQKAGLDGIKKLNPTRYAGLNIAHDGLSYDIFSDVARLLRQQPQVVLGGLQPRQLLAAGQSQSALRLTTYVNAFAPRERLYDAFLIHSRGAFPAGLQGLIGGPLVARIRTDLDVPVFQLETEFDTGPALFARARQPDTPLIRTWEVAGAAHIDRYFLDPVNAQMGSSQGMSLNCAKPFNNLPFYRVEKAVLRHLQAWMTQGKAPPTAPPLATTRSGTFQRDGVGNALGGVRLPEIEAPTEHYALSNSPKSGASSGSASASGLASLVGLMGCTFVGAALPLTDAQLGQLYASRADYLSRYQRAAAAAVAAGHLLPEDAAVGVAEAQARALTLVLPAP